MSKTETIDARFISNYGELGRFYADLFPDEDWVYEHTDEDGNIDYWELGKNSVENVPWPIGDFTKTGFRFVKGEWYDDDWDKVKRAVAKGNEKR